MSDTLDYAILGGGLAGLLLARRLLEAGTEAERLAVFDADSRERASSAPGALMHPFPGRTLAPKLGALEEGRESTRTIRRWRRELGADAILELSMTRPLFGEMGERLRTSWKEAHEEYPDWLTSDLLDGDACAEVDPALGRFDAVIRYAPAFSVDLRAVCKHLRESLADSGVALVDGHATGLDDGGDRWSILVDEADIEYSARRVVLAVGSSLRHWFPQLPLSPRGGELLVVRPPAGRRLDCVINAGGHVAPHPNGTWVAGSSWWDAESFEARTDDAAIEAIHERCARLVPALRDAEPLEVWRGVRAISAADHRPYVGPVPDYDNLFVFGAFGAKGLLRIPFFARRLAHHLAVSRPLPDRVDPDRLKRYRWDMVAG